MRTSAMASDATVSYTHHDDLPPDAARAVDEGLGQSNAAAAPLHEVRPLGCFARTESGEVVGGAVGRTWGSCCELQQLWVDHARRGKGIGARLVREFESLAQQRGCTTFYLETFTFQAPRFYQSLGYRIRYEHAVYPHGIVRCLMVRTIE